MVRTRAFLGSVTLVVLLAAVFVAAGSLAAFASDGTFITQWGGNGSGDGQFNRPHDVAVGPGGTVFVMDTVNNRVQVFDPAGAYVSKFTASSTGMAYGIHVDAAGSVFVADSGGTGSVRKYSGSGALQLTLSGVTGARDVVTDADGNIYVTSQTGNAVRKYSGTGTLLATWSGYSSPRCIAVAPSGDMYVTEFVAGTVNRVRQITTAGAEVRRWDVTGNPGVIGVAVGPDGSVYVAEYLANRIEKFTAEGAPLTSWTGGFNGVRGVALGADGLAYVADTDNHLVRKYGSTPAVITVGGVSAGGSYTAPVTITFSADDPGVGPVTPTATLNGAAFTSGSAVSAPGSYTLVVTATDAAGTVTTTTIAFTIAAAPVVSTPASSWWSLAALAAAAGLGIAVARRRSASV